MKFVDPTKLYRKSGGMGHPGIGCIFCRGQEMPRFISRGPATPVDGFKESRMGWQPSFISLTTRRIIEARCMS